jgi:preprotein translocase subunit SecA
VAITQFIKINGQQAETFIKWEMVHYDVQLFGGVVLSQRKNHGNGYREGKTLVVLYLFF